MTLNSSASLIVLSVLTYTLSLAKVHIPYLRSLDPPRPPALGAADADGRRCGPMLMLMIVGHGTGKHWIDHMLKEVNDLFIPSRSSIGDHRGVRSTCNVFGK